MKGQTGSRELFPVLYFLIRGTYFRLRKTSSYVTLLHPVVSGQNVSLMHIKHVEIYADELGSW